jgi:hypothetical protein
MAALTGPRNTPRRGTLDPAFPVYEPIPVAADTKIWVGSMVGMTTAGVLVPAAITVGLKVLGRAVDTFDNLDGSAGDINGIAERGSFSWANGAGDDEIEVADIGSPAYALDDQTVGIRATVETVDRPRVGIIRAVNSTGVVVQHD